MDARTFLDNFGVIADSPGGIDRLRALILNLAIAGRLVEQRPNESPVDGGLQAIRVEKGDLVKAKVPGRVKVPRFPEASETNRHLPDGWCWARIDDTGEYINGLAFKNSDWFDSGLPIIRIQNLTNRDASFNYARGTYPEDRLVDDGDILVSWSATLEAFIWDRGPAVLNQHIFKVVPDARVVVPNFLYLLLRHTIRDLAESDAAHGLAMKHINRGPFVAHVIQLPPIEEQARIVSKVDELLQGCDELETRHQARLRAATRFRASSLDALASAQTVDDLRATWLRVHANWDAITDSPGGVEDLRQTVLQLATRGRLVSQKEDDEPATESIRRSLEVLNSTKRRTIQGPPTSEVAHLPRGWTWANLACLCETQTGSTPPTELLNRDGPRIAYVTPAQLGGLTVDQENLIPLAAARSTRRVAAPGSVLFVGIGGSIGKSGITTAETTFNQQIHAATPVEADPGYLGIVVASPFFQAATHQRTSATAIPIINKSKWETIPIPLPPLNEQRRIAATVERLLNLCKGLEISVQARTDAASRLAAASDQLAR